MKYRVKVNELRSGNVIVEAESEEAAKRMASVSRTNFIDSEITDITVEPVEMEPNTIWNRETLCEPFIWNAEDWAFEEWKTLCKICGLPAEKTERIVLRANEIESFLDFSKKIFCTKRKHIVAEVCPHCGNEIEMRWDTRTKGFKVFCPVCGERLMLCDECRHAENSKGCAFAHNR